MPRFSYRARDAGGRLVEGLLEAADAGAAAAQVLQLGASPLAIEPSARPAERAETTGDATPWWRHRRLDPTEVMLFCRQMHALMKAGVPILRALGSLRESGTHPVMREAIGAVAENLDGGRDLSSSMARQPRVFSPFFVAMVYVGESTGRLEEIFLRLFHHLEFQEFMRGQVRSALRYPAFVVAAMAGALLVINLFVIPAFAKVYRGFGSDLPLVTRGLIAFSDFLVAWWSTLAVGGVAAVFGARAWLRTPAGRLWWDRVRLRLPIAGKIVAKATVARFARGFALAYRSGVPVTQALSLTAHTLDNTHFAAKVEHMREGVERGESVLRTARNAAVFTPVALQMLAVGEESGSLDDMMDEVAALYQREVEYELKTLSAQIEPILIVGLGVLVLIMALGVFLPIWDLGQAAMHK